MNKCEACDGTGTIKVTGFINRASGCQQVHDEPMKCHDCRGAGEISDLTLKLRRIGKFIKDDRISIRMSQREQADLLGVSFSFLNDIEHGWIPADQ